MAAGSSRELAAAPRLADGVRLLGEYEGSGFTEPRYLVARADGQLLHLSRLLFLVASALDGQRDGTDVAARVSAAYGRTLTPDGLTLLLEHRLEPMGITHRGDPADGADAVGTPAPTAPPAPGAPSAVPPKADPLLSLRLRRVLVPPRATRAIAAALSPLFHPAAMAVALPSLVAADVWLLRGTELEPALAVTLQTPPIMLALVAVLVGSTLFHEFGHAAACRYGGAAPGAIGMGLYVIYPAFYTDVTQSYRLNRLGRLRTDLGGVYFNGLFCLALSALYWQTGYPPILLAVVLVHVELLQQLMPLGRLDGYFVVADAVGVPDLFSRIGPILRSLLPGREPGPRVRELRPAARLVVTGWVLTAVPLMVGLLGMLVWNLPDMFTAVASAMAAHGRELTEAVVARDPARALLAGLSVVLLPLPLIGVALLLVGIARRTLAMVLRLTAASRASRPPSPHGLQPAGRHLQEVTMSGSKPAPVLPMLDPPYPPPERVPAEAPVTCSAAVAMATAPVPAKSGATHSAAEFTEEAMLRRCARPAGRGWRRVVFSATRGLVNLGPSAAERRELELLGLVRTPIRGCRRIVVLSRKGGAGKTTTALMLGHTFASHRGDRVIALDANPDAGSLAHRMRRETTSTVTDLLQERQYIERYADMRGYTSQAAESRLEVVASDDDPRISQALGEEDYRTAIDILDRHYNLVLVDTGTGILDSAIRGVLSEADQIVVVMPPALDGARVAAMTLDWLEQHDHADLVHGAVAVVNAVHGQGRLELDRIDEHFAARCSAVVHIPWDVTLQAGAHTTLADLRRETRDAYVELAAAVGRTFDTPARRPHDAARQHGTVRAARPGAR
jgi:putative peptide zinc metalloprotease protein